MGQRHKLYGQLQVDGQVNVSGEMDVTGAVNVGGALIVTDDTTTTLTTGTTGSLVYYDETTKRLTYGGPPAALEKLLKHASTGAYSYCGQASDGSLESEAVWTITRIQVLDDGSTSITTASSVDWTNYLTHTYS